MINIEEPGIFIPESHPKYNEILKICNGEDINTEQDISYDDIEDQVNNMPAPMITNNDVIGIAKGM